ncbi:GyrI-like domain-containing protein [Microbacterium sp. CCH5-D1]|uniref:GyrI-like domain-containing protein n=1 Tax=Microbacterium sp. CCH5-D1 TaxID=1768780 RepID=UPI002F91B2E1
MKKREPIPALDSVRLQTLDEGSCVQTLHVGPFDDEGPVLEELHHHFIPDNGLQMRGLHHEIYLSDLRRADPAKLRTILRQPIMPHA